MTVIRQTLCMTHRHLRELWRQPWFVAVTLVQPVIWLLLFGALFKKVIEIPGFHAHPYIAFLAPGVVVMTAMFNAAWSGMSLIVGASFPGGVGGVAVLFAVSALLGATFGALSNGFGLIMRQEEARLGAGRIPGRVPGRAARAVPGVRDERVPVLSAVGLAWAAVRRPLRNASG